MPRCAHPADSAVTLYTLPSLDKAPPLPLPLPRPVHALAATTATAAYARDPPPDPPGDLLVLGGRKKVVLYGASPGPFSDPWELPLPHSPRHIVFPPPAPALPESIHLQFTASASAILHLHPSSPAARLSIADLTTDPVPPAAPSSPSPPDADEQSGYGKGALSGLGGYVGLGAKQPTPAGTHTVPGEVLLAREGASFFLAPTLTVCRHRRVLLVRRQLYQTKIHPLAVSARRYRIRKPIHLLYPAVAAFVAYCPNPPRVHTIPPPDCASAASIYRKLDRYMFLSHLVS